MDLVLINKILVLIINIAGIFLALWVYSANRKNRINRTYFLMTVFSIFWINCAYLSNLSNQEYLVRFWARLGYGLVAIWLISFHFFSIYLIREEKEKTPILNKLVIVGIGLFLFSFSTLNSLLVSGVKFAEQGSFPVLGKGKFVYFGIIFFWTIFIIWHLFAKYLKISKKEKLKIQYFLLGIFIFVLANLIFNVILPSWKGIPQYYQFGNYSAIFLLGFTALAIVKKQLFGIRVILAQLLVGLIAILLLVNFFISESMLEYVWKGALFVAFVFFGILLIKSVLKEIKQKEELDKLATQLATANIRLEGAYKKLQRLDEVKTDFISITSHQLRTPLSVVKGYISMLLEGDYGKLPRNLVRPMDNVFEATERLITLVNSLLDISRLEAGKETFNPAETNLEDLIVELVKDFVSVAEKKGIKLKFEKPLTKIPLIQADKEKLRQAISNLIDNALKYTPKGSITVKAEVCPNAEGGEKIMITVSDTGSGMTKEEIEKLFQTFSRGAAGLMYWMQGAGLGLYIAKKFIEMHKGNIWAQSEGKDKGSTFVIELPML